MRKTMPMFHSKYEDVLKKHVQGLQETSLCHFIPSDRFVKNNGSKTPSCLE